MTGAAVVLLLVSAAVMMVSASGSGGVAGAAPYPCTWTYPSGDTADLSSLYLPQGDYSGTDGQYDYRGNVCGASNSGAGCTDKDYTICQYSQAGGTFVSSLGSFNSPPTWSVISLPPNPPEPEINGVQYTFTNGDICWIAGRQQVKTVINVFRCTEGSTQKTVTVEEDQTTCTFTITYKSPAACKTGSGTQITNSTYTDKNTRSKWDLTPLHRTQGSGDYVKESGAYNYSMNIGDLTTVTGACRTAGHSICQWDYRGQFFAGLGGFYMKPVGLWNLIASDPSVGIRQTYKNGEPCYIAGQQVPRTSIISYYCDPTGPRQFQVVVDAPTCTYKFNWYVAEGCPSRA